jgi:hypothetical protein
MMLPPLIARASLVVDQLKREKAGNCTHRDFLGPRLRLVLVLLRWLRCRGSLFETTQGAMSGIVQKELNVSICFATFWDNCSTCFLMYCKNASLDHLPMSMMVYTGTPAWYISIAAPEQRE